MYYYPTALSKLNTDKLSQYIKPTTFNIIMLYSDEGVFKLKNETVYRQHFGMENTNYKHFKIADTEFICDNSEVLDVKTHKLPFDFEQYDISVFCFEKGSVKFFVQKNNDIVIHSYFHVKHHDTYGIEDDIDKIIKYAQS